MANIREVAKQAGVGIGTVSRALNGTGYVAEETKQRIFAIAKEMDYKPNELARNLARNRTGIIGIIVPDMENPFFSKLLKHLETGLYKEGYKALICNTVDTAGISRREQEFIEMLRQNVMDGVITGAHSVQDEVYQHAGKPIVAIDRDLGRDIPVIHSDHREGGRLAAKLLLDSGCKNILQFGGAFHVRTPSNERHIEFARAVEAAGARVRTVEMAWNMMEYEYYQRLTVQYLDVFPEIDGIFGTDIGALYSLSLAAERGIRVPQDLCIVGYDGIDITRLFNPVLTSIAQDIPALADRCVRTMMDLLEGKPVEMEQIVPVKVQAGRTVRTPGCAVVPCNEEHEKGKRNMPGDVPHAV